MKDRKRGRYKEIGKEGKGEVKRDWRRRRSRDKLEGHNKKLK